LNFLALCQMTYSLLRAGEERSPAPDTVEGQSSVNGEIVRWVAQADLDIQNEKEAWLFLRKEGLINVSEGVSSFNPSDFIGGFGELALANNEDKGRYAMMFRDSRADETPIRYVPWESWQFGIFDRGQRGTGRPVRMTLRPDGNVQIDPVPDSNYVMRLPYKMAPLRMTANDSLSPIPERHRMAIVWWAIARYYCVTRDGTGEFLAKAQRELDREMNRLCQTQLPEFITADGVYLR
jgi:hypothetical protein